MGANTTLRYDEVLARMRALGFEPTTRELAFADTLGRAAQQSLAASPLALDTDEEFLWGDAGEVATAYYSSGDWEVRVGGATVVGVDAAGVTVTGTLLAAATGQAFGAPGTPWDQIYGGNLVSTGTAAGGVPAVQFIDQSGAVISTVVSRKGASDDEVYVQAVGGVPVEFSLAGDVLATAASQDLGSVGQPWDNLYATSLFGTGATFSGLTLGSVLFAGAAGAVTQDNANLFWDATNNRLGIGTAVPLATLSVEGTQHLGFTATTSGVHASHLEADAAGFGDVKALHIVYRTGALALGEDEGVVLVNVDESGATGGDVFALEVLATEGSANVWGLKAAALVGPIHQDSGVFADMDSALVNAVDELVDLTNPAANTSIFVADNDTVTIGDAAKFEELEFLLSTDSSGAGIAPTFEFSTGIGGWAAFTPVDGTTGMRNSGVVAWDDADIPGWNTGVGAEYLIQITRTRNSLTTTPVASLVQIAAVVEYTWDKSGNVNVASLTASGLTSGRVALVGASGLITDDAGLTYGSAVLTVGSAAGEGGLRFIDSGGSPVLVTAGGGGGDYNLYHRSLAAGYSHHFRDSTNAYAPGFASVFVAKTGTGGFYLDNTGDYQAMYRSGNDLVLKAPAAAATAVTISSAGLVTAPAFAATSTSVASTFAGDVTMDSTMFDFDQSAGNFGFGSAAAGGTDSRMLLDFTTRVVNAGTSASVFHFTPRLTEAASGTHALLAGVRIDAFDLTDDAGGATTAAATLYIAGAPSVGTNKYALYVDAGASRFDGNMGFYATAPVAQQVSAADLTNNVGAGGTNDQIDNWSDLSTYATDAAAIRNAVYQLARKLKLVNDGLRAYGLFT